ncbi:MAG: hypothetical protein KJP23_16065 [Deltaproteobacteria bacterium]|nr:hypothetical protein [Deltaproteobacteria bacterium]
MKKEMRVADLVAVFALLILSQFETDTPPLLYLKEMEQFHPEIDLNIET